jgi:hypothetical protein
MTSAKQWGALTAFGPSDSRAIARRRVAYDLPLVDLRGCIRLNVQLCLVLLLHRNDQLDTAARNRTDDRLALAIISNSHSGRADTSRKRGIRDNPSAPDVGDQLVVADEFSIRGRKTHKQIEDLRLNMHILTIAAKPMHSPIELTVSENVPHEEIFSRTSLHLKNFSRRAFAKAKLEQTAPEGRFPQLSPQTSHWGRWPQCPRYGRLEHLRPVFAHTEEDSPHEHRDRPT